MQKLAYQSEARLYDDWSLPPLTQTLESLRDEFDNSVVLKALMTARSWVRCARAMRTTSATSGGSSCSRTCRAAASAPGSCAHIEREFARTQRFELFTGSRSEGNIRLYERLGYRRRREQPLSPGVTLVFMEKRR